MFNIAITGTFPVYHSFNSFFFAFLLYYLSYNVIKDTFLLEHEDQLYYKLLYIVTTALYFMRTTRAQFFKDT